MRKVIQVGLVLTFLCSYPVVVLGKCYVLTNDGNCSDYYGDWVAGLGTSCVCNQQTHECTQRIYSDYAAESEWNLDRGVWEGAVGEGYTGKEEREFNCVTSGTCAEQCIYNELLTWACVKNPPPTTQQFTVYDDRLMGVPCN
jgi:hypothetical protein